MSAHRAPNQPLVRLTPRHRILLAAATVAALLLAAVWQSGATAESGMSQLELAQTAQRNCQVLLAKATSSAQRTRARQCIADQQVIIDALSGPTPSPSASQTPSPSPSPTVAPSPTVSPTATTTPAPTPTASPTGTLTDCLHQLAACGYPNAGNTGPSGTLSVVGSQTVNTSGTVLANLDIRGCVAVNAANVTIRNSKVSGCGDYVRVRSNSTNLTLVDVEVDCGGGYGMAVGFGNYTLLRADLHNCENGGHIDGAVTVQDSWVHDLGGGADGHFDGFQFGQGAAAVNIVHNTIYNQHDQTSAIIMWDEGDPQNRDVAIRGNLLAGGGWTLYCGRFGSAVNVSITNNRFVGGVMVNGDWQPDPGGAQYGYANACDSGGEVWSGNVRDLNGSLLPAA